MAIDLSASTRRSWTPASPVPESSLSVSLLNTLDSNTESAVELGFILASGHSESEKRRSPAKLFPKYPPAPRLPYGEISGSTFGKKPEATGIYSRRNVPLPSPFTSQTSLHPAKQLQMFPSRDKDRTISVHWKTLTVATSLLGVLLALIVMQMLAALPTDWYFVGETSRQMVPEDAKQLAERWENETESERSPGTLRIAPAVHLHHPPVYPSNTTVVVTTRTLKDPKIYQQHPPFEPQIPFDYALASLGARVLTTRSTKPLLSKEARFMGFSIYEQADADSMSEAPLLPIIIPGRCWRFQGFPGQLVIQLAEKIYITSFALSHISSETAPSHRLRSAPHHFEVWALSHQDDTDGHVLGNYTYHLSGYNPTQHFPVLSTTPKPFDVIELKILSNHGLEDYTCVYRFKVFGYPELPT